jgi:tetratricopeptide (TPR) repeat protein
LQNESEFDTPKNVLTLSLLNRAFVQTRFRAKLFAVLITPVFLLGCSSAKSLPQPETNQKQTSKLAEDFQIAQNQKPKEDDLKQLKALADEYNRKANYLAAEPLYKEVLLTPTTYNSILNISDFVDTANKLARIYEMREQYDATEFCHRFALEALKKSSNATARDKALAMYKLGCSRQQHGDYKGVEQLFRESYQILKKEVATDPTDAEALNIMAYLTFLSTDSSGAHELWSRALKAALKKSGKERLHATESLHWLAGTPPWRATDSRIKQNELLYRQAVDVTEDVLGKNDPEVANQLEFLGRFYTDEVKDQERGSQCYARSLKIRESALYEFAPEIGNSLRELASCKYWQGKKEEATVLEKRSNAIKTKFLIPGGMWFSGSDRGLEFCLKESGKHSEAQFLSDRASLVPGHPWACGPRYKLE